MPTNSKEYMRNYYHKNKADKYDAKIECECGRHIKKTEMCRHKKTKIHQSLIENKKSVETQTD